MDSELGDDVLNFIHNDLRSRFNLDMSKRSNPTLCVDDLVDILHHHWKFDTSTYCDERQRVQVALLLTIAAYTGSRPSSMLNTSILDTNSEDEQNNSLSTKPTIIQEKTKAICYRHIKLYLVKDKTPTGRAKVVVLLTLPHGKGEDRKPQPKTFLFYENPNLLLCPVALILALASHDKAFAAKGANIQKILNARVPHHKPSIRVHWNQDAKDKPIMRGSHITEGGRRTSPTLPLCRSSISNYLLRLGQACGFQDNLTCYCFRRGTGNAVDSVATAAERDQIMGHSDSTIFQFYLTQKVKCDVQAAFLDEPKNSSLIKITGAMRFTADSHAPRTLTQEQRNAITNSPTVLSMARKIETLMQAKRKCQSIYQDTAKVDQLAAQHQEATRQLKAHKVREERHMLRALRTEHFQTSDTRELERQFVGIQAQNSDPEQVEKPIYDIPERRRLVAILHVTTENIQMAPLAKFRYRLDFIDSLALLCTRRDPRNRGHHPEVALRRLPGSRIRPFFPLKTNTRQCLFCLGDKKLTLKKRGFCWTTRYKMWDHVESHHLRHIAPNKSFTCPHPQCHEDGVEVVDIIHFKNHAARIHGVLLRAKRI
ncbi:MAG: hypothetical protein Q9165_008843 [Trypethelium subeluteriae]